MWDHRVLIFSMFPIFMTRYWYAEQPFVTGSGRVTWALTFPWLPQVPAI